MASDAWLDGDLGPFVENQLQYGHGELGQAALPRESEELFGLQ